MKIQSLQYEDLSTGWKLDLIEFNPQLTLLVGVSGVGKTKILEALLNLKKISQGESLNGAKWEIIFINSHGENCKWSGCFENKGFISEYSLFEQKEKKFFIEIEELFVNNELTVERNASDIIFNGKKTVKLSPQQSVIYLLMEEDKIKSVYNEFEKIIFNNRMGVHQHYKSASEKVDLNTNKYKNLIDIRNSNEDIFVKLYFTYKNENVFFKKILANFISIFPYVEDIGFKIVAYNKNWPSLFFERVSIEIKEKNLSILIEEKSISSGMKKTLTYLSELYLCSDGTVILMDEFENNLGLNCINEVTSSILSSERDLQFIITSHHPYIINNIDYHYWKLVTRNGSVVKAEDATKYGIGKSKHQAFTQLANLDEFSEGIVS